jgi:hypothetical protein
MDQSHPPILSRSSRRSARPKARLARDVRSVSTAKHYLSPLSVFAQMPVNVISKLMQHLIVTLCSFVGE